MPTYFQRPENALKRANEFIDVGKKQRALDALYDVIKSKKHRTWQKIHEPIMEKYLELCVELKKSHIAKEGLYQYKNICQQVNIKSLEDVVRNYLKLAEEKTEAAREESQQAVVDIDDLDNLLTPESLLLSAVSGEDTQDRTDRVVLTPWVKFLWESYRQCLELLRNNSRVEALYHDIARQAFKFCLKYTRKTEFRKLCESLRTHLGHIHKHQNQQTSINLNNPESQAMHLETRLVQLDSAINMELWQEAYKAIEDIHLLMTLSKKPPKPQLMANYYQKLALVFWKAGNYLFHASALHRLFHLSRELKKNLTQEEVQRMASKVLLATLSIPIPPSRNEIDKYLELDDTTIEKQRRLATLLSLPNAPTRASLIKDLVKYSVIQFVVPEIQNLYYWLEVEFHPLHLCKQVSKCFDFISESKEADIQQYMPALQDITIMRLLKQVSQVYQTIEFSRLASLAPFAPQFRLERLIVDAARTCDLQVRIDHRTRTLSFGTDLGVGQREDVPEGPYLQSMPSEQIRNQLIQMSAALHKTVDLIQPAMRKAEQDTLRGQVISAYRSSAKKEHQRILIRRQIIEERKEMLENLNVQREQEEQKLLEEQKRKIYEAEKLRLEREAEERDRLRRQEEHEKIQKMQIQERIEQLIKSGLGPKIFKDLDEEELRSLNAEDIMAKQVEQLDREKRELTARLKAQEKKVDYFARARRVEEIPLLQKQYEEQAVKDREFWDQQEQERIKTAIQERQQALEMRNRLCHMQADKNKFLEQLKASRMSVYEEKLSAFETMLEEERQKRLSERKQQRKLERKITRKKEKEEEEKRKKEEEARKELAKKKAEEDAAYKARLVKLEEIAAKQRAREREIEERTAKIAEESRFAQEKDRDGNERSGLWRGSAREDTNTDTKQYSVKGGWREREKERERSWRAPNLDDRSDSPTYGKSDREVDKEDGNEQNWRSRPTIADDSDKKKDDKGPPRIKNDNRVDEVRSAPEEAWRSSTDDRRAPDSGRRGQFDDSRRAPPDDIRRGPSDDRDWRRDDRNQTPRDDRSWRRDDKRSRGPDDDWRRNDRSVDKDRRMPIRRDENKDWRFSDREPSRTDDKKWRKEDSFSRFDSDKGRRPLREQGDKDRIDDDDKSWRKDVRTPQKRNEDVEWQGSRERSSGLSKDRDDRDSVRDRDDRSFLRDKEDRGFGRERDDRNFLRDRDDKNSFRDRDDRNLLRDRDSFRDRDDRSSFRDREDRSFLRDREERGPLRDREERGLLRDREERGPLRDREERGPLRDRDDRGPIRDSRGSAFERDRYPARKIDDESLKEERGGRRSEGKRREVEDEEGWRTVKH